VTKLLPIYRDQDATYQADACRPLLQATRSGELQFAARARGHYPGQRLPTHALSAVKTVGVWDAEHDQKWGLDWHRNEGLELTYLERGRLSFAVDDRRYELEPDDLTITRPWQPHRVGAPHVTAGRLHWVVVDVGIRHPHQSWRWPNWLVLTSADLHQLTEILSQNEQPVWHACEETRRCFQRIGRVVEASNHEDIVSWLAVYLNELLLHLLAMFRTERAPLDSTLTSTRRTVALFWDELRGNATQLAQEWTVPRMASCCGLGVTQFLHYSKQLNNMTPAPYLTYCRAEAAARMLREQPSETVTDIALSCGFSTSQYFASVFRRQYGCTPNAYRRRA